MMRKKKKITVSIVSFFFFSGLVFWFFIRPDIGLESGMESVMRELAGQKNVKVTVSHVGKIAVPVRKELIEWEKTVARETRELVTSGQTDLDKVKKLVSRETEELETKARAAYINQWAEISGRMAEEGFRQSDPEFEEIYQKFSGKNEEIQREIFDNHFDERKNRLIEEHFYGSIASRRQSSGSPRATDN